MVLMIKIMIIVIVSMIAPLGISYHMFCVITTYSVLEYRQQMTSNLRFMQIANSDKPASGRKNAPISGAQR